MGEWMEAYIEGKDVEPDYCTGLGRNKDTPFDHYERIGWVEGDIPDFFSVTKPKYKECCWACKHNCFLTGYCRIDFTLMMGSGHCSKNFEPHTLAESRVVWSFLYECWRHFYNGNEHGYKKWKKTEEGAKYYWLAEAYLREEKLL